jgi:hypothetical protein
VDPAQGLAPDGALQRLDPKGELADGQGALREYLRIIYEPEYTTSHNLERQ